MKTTDERITEAQNRRQDRFADRKEIGAANLTRQMDLADTTAPANAITSEILRTAERAIAQVDEAFTRLEYLRIELVQITTGERSHQTENAPRLDDLVRELGELSTLLHVHKMLGDKEVSR